LDFVDNSLYIYHCDSMTGLVLSQSRFTKQTPASDRRRMRTTGA